VPEITPANIASDFVSLKSVASRHLRDGNIIEGICAYQKLLHLRNDYADGWYNLAYLQRCARHFEDSLQSYAKALEFGVSKPEEVRVNRAAILSEHLESGEAAEKELLAALQVNPHYLPACLNLGNLYEDWGQLENARSAYERTLVVAPANGRAHARLAALDIFQSKSGVAIPRLRAALKSPNLSIEDTTELQFALGHCLDAESLYDEAYSSFVAANRACREMARPKNVYDRTLQNSLIERLIDVFPEQTPHVHQIDLPSPIFICGMFRSGSTLAEQILARHSRVTAGGEFDFLPAIVHEHLRPFPEAVISASAEQLDTLRNVYLDRLRSVRPNYDVVTDKRPDNFLHIGLIKTLFPRAKIIHTTRNPIDLALSVFFLHFDDSVGYASNLDDIVHYYAGYRALMRHWKAAYGPDIYDLSYDALVAKPERTMRELFDFCALEWEDSCLEAGNSTSAVKTASAWQVRKSLHSKSSSRWKNYAVHIGGLISSLNAL
jgi:tetratricopeptide (TPR) repeat protein